jgi:hypothetical protein
VTGDPGPGQAASYGLWTSRGSRGLPWAVVFGLSLETHILPLYIQRSFRTHAFCGQVHFQSSSRIRRSPEFLLLKLLRRDRKYLSFYEYGLHLRKYPVGVGLSLGFEGRAYQQIILRAGWAWIVRSMLRAVSHENSTSFGSLMHSAVNVRMGSKEDRPLL